MNEMKITMQMESNKRFLLVTFLKKKTKTVHFHFGDRKSCSSFFFTLFGS